MQRWLRRRALRRDGNRPEEEVFGRFSEVYGAAARPRQIRNGTPKAPPNGSPLDVLGLTDRASMQEVATAYRKLARAHHPDKVANEPPQVRKDAERRMKEINAAYSLLRRSGNNLGEGAGRG